MVSDNLKTRLRYRGGNQEQRFIKDKETSLKRALLYSYQAATLERLTDNAQFRCLINTDKVKLNYDTKILSIPYRSIRLNPPCDKIKSKTSYDEEETNIKPGSVFRWVETNTYWLVTLEHIEEDAYFRAEIYRCDQQIQIADKDYWVYIRGPVETAFEWNQKSKVMWNDLNYTLIMYITKDENTKDYFHRFSTVKIDGQTWQVAATNPYYGDGIIEVMLTEAQNNIYADMQQESETEISDETFIKGKIEVYPYDTIKYTVEQGGGRWYLSNSKAVIKENTETSATIEILTANSGSFIINYDLNGNVYQLPIKIKSL